MLYVVGIGPGGPAYITKEADDALWESEILNNLPLGRWKFVLEISYSRIEKYVTPTQKAYFECQVFIKDTQH